MKWREDFFECYFLLLFCMINDFIIVTLNPARHAIQAGCLRGYQFVCVYNLWLNIEFGWQFWVL
jgi:hypothetical protein